LSITAYLPHNYSKSVIPKPPTLRPEESIVSNWEYEIPPLVSVWCWTYNHIQFLDDALRGILGQVTNFPFELILRDDASNDGTTDIVRKYASIYPNIIVPIIEPKNTWGKVNILQVFQNHSRGEFVSFNDGDDYWFDENKLQSQLSILRKDKSFAMASHSVEVISGNSLQSEETKQKIYHPIKSTRLNFKDILDHHSIPTLSLTYRASLLKEFPSWMTRIRSGDIAVELLLAAKGDCYYDFKPMGVYRMHSGGVSANKEDNEASAQAEYFLYDSVNHHLQFRYSKLIEKRKAKTHWKLGLHMIKNKKKYLGINLILKAFLSNPFLIYKIIINLFLIKLKIISSFRF
jgi:glycosyltransferase involved in cell wall biosynthesis